MTRSCMAGPTYLCSGPPICADAASSACSSCNPMRRSRFVSSFVLIVTPNRWNGVVARYGGSWKRPQLIAARSVDVEKFAWPRHSHRLILFPIEVPGCRVHRDDEFRVCGKRAFEKTVVGFVPDDTELGQRITHREARNDFGDEFWVVAEDIRVLFQDCGTYPRLNEIGACELVDDRRGVVLGRGGREFQNAVSRTTRKVGPGAPKRPCASLGFDERNRLGLGYRLAPILAVRSRQRRGELEPDTLPPTTAVAYMKPAYAKGSHRHNRFGPAFRPRHA